MPTYDYECSACGHRFDELQSFNDPVLTKCPKCKKNKLERLFGGGGAIIFKGGGFYETDYPPRRAKGRRGRVEARDQGRHEGGRGPGCARVAPAPARTGPQGRRRRW
jgi:putative FmdB family regulatory protein